MDKQYHTRNGDKAGEDPGSKDERIEEQLEEGLKGTFPGSDPVSVVQPQKGKKREEPRRGR